jgi:hypothetical protein
VIGDRREREEEARMDRYMLLIHSDEDAWGRMTEEERAGHMAAYGALWGSMRDAGHAVEGDELSRAGTATLVRVRDGETLTSDGPFAETKEQLGGYFLLECDLETAVGYAARIPSAATGTIEVRRVGTLEEG